MAYLLQFMIYVQQSQIRHKLSAYISLKLVINYQPTAVSNSSLIMIYVQNSFTIIMILKISFIQVLVSVPQVTFHLHFFI